MAQSFVLRGYQVKASTSSKSRLSILTSANLEAFIVDIENLHSNIQAFLQSSVLIINIPSKNRNGFHALLKEIEKSTIKKVLFVSSTSVYENNNKIVSESDGEESPQSPLLIIEKLFRNACKFKTTIVRFGGLIGYGRNPGKFFRKGRSIENPDSPVNLIHRDDCIEIITQIVEKEIWDEVFNCCADTHPTKREFYTRAAQSIGAIAPEFVNSGTESFKIINNQKVKHLLGYEFIHPNLMKINFEKNS